MDEVTVGLLQLDYPDDESRAERLERVVGLVEAAPPADLLVLPELWDVAYFDFDAYAGAAQPLDTGPAAALAPLARARPCHMVAGSVLERAGDRLHNTTVVLGPTGERLAAYRKVHLFEYGSRETELLTPGDEIVVVPTALGHLGLAICMDLRYPAHFAALRSAGADLAVVVAAWPTPRAGHWETLVAARAIDTQTPVVAVNGTGRCAGVELAGASRVVSARGEVLADSWKAPGWATAVVDRADTVAWRAEFPL